jgi:hypothetical protein
MAQVKLSGTLPKDDTGANGLDVLARELTMRPTVPQFVIGMVVAPKTVQMNGQHGSTSQPQVVFIAVEGVTEQTDRDAVQAMIERYRQRRGGRNPDQLDVFNDDVDA